MALLFDTTDFPARWSCGSWSHWHGWLHIVSDLAIFGAYVAIPCVLGYTVLRRREPWPQVFRKLLPFFIAFILLCGLSHLNEAIIFWHPIYRFAGVTKAATAVVSVATVAALIPSIPTLLSLKSPDVLIREVAAKTEALRKQRDVALRLASVVENSSDAIVGWSLGGEINTVNIASRRLFHAADAELVGRQLGDLLDHDTLRLVQGLQERAACAQEPEAVGTVLESGDDVTPVELVVSRVIGPEGQTVGFSAVIRDISERKAAEDLFQQAVAAAPNGMVGVDQDGRILFANQAANRIFGYEANQLVDLPVDELVPAAHRPTHAGDRAAFHAAPRARAMGLGANLLARRRDGSQVPVEIGLNPIETPSGPIVLCGVVDRSEQVARDAVVRAQADALRQSNEELRQFAYGASHDLQEPLRAVSLFSELLAEEASDALNADARGYLREIRESTVHLGDLVRDLLEYARTAQDPVPTREADTDQALDTALHLLRGQITQTNAKVERSALPIVRGSQTAIGHVFQNLISNAIKFRRCEPQVLVEAKPQGEEWLFKVEDNGIGVPNEHHEQVFEMFWRLHTKDEIPGTGLGLALAQKIVVWHGGRMWIESNSGVGTSVYFTLPREAKRIDD